MSKIKVSAGWVPPGGCEEKSMSHLSPSFQWLSGILGCFLACRGISPICPCLHIAYSSVSGCLFLFLQKSVSSDLGLTPFIKDDLIFRSLIKSAKILFPNKVTSWAYLLRVVGGVVGEGNGTQLQHSCLENPMDRGA